jgi:apoptosis-inducing factor 3
LLSSEEVQDPQLGAGGLIAAETLSSEGFAGEVVMLSRESYLPIDRPKLSKALKIDASKIALLTAQDFESMKVKVKLSTVVSSVDPTSKTVKTTTGETVSYDHLVLATGGDPRVLPFPGKDLENIFVMRSVPDSNKIEECTYD